MAGTNRSGRKPVPTTIKLLRGNPGRRPLNDAEPKPPVKLPPPPPELSDAAKKEWRKTGRKLVAMGVMTELDGPMLAAVVVPYTRFLEMQGLLAKSSVLLKRSDGTLYINPLVRIARECQEQFTRALAEFGMSPVSRSRVKATPPEAVDPLADYFGETG